jgi:hypothetical protein
MIAREIISETMNDRTRSRPDGSRLDGLATGTTPDASTARAGGSPAQPRGARSGGG